MGEEIQISLIQQKGGGVDGKALQNRSVQKYI